MKRILPLSLWILVLLFAGFKMYQETDIDDLRKRYSSGDYSQWPAPALDSAAAEGFEDIGHLPEMEFPEDNPYSDAKAELGKTLFFDPRLSGSGQIACATCHDSELAWGDGRRVSYGHDRRLGRRNSMTLLNVGYADSLFWDGRAVSLEDQVGFPIQDTVEMNAHVNLAVERIAAIEGYQPLFKEAFGETEVSEQKIRKAIATYERTIVSESTKFDRFIDGESAIYSDKEVLGLHLYRTKARCINCHNSGYFSDNKFHNDGLTYYGRKFEDLGLFDLTGKTQDVGKFRTPSLREASRTQPYMHNGIFPHLEGVVNMYNAGMPRVAPKPHQVNDSLYPVTSPLLKELNLNDYEKEALIAFIKTLESRKGRELPPELPQ